MKNQFKIFATWLLSQDQPRITKYPYVTEAGFPIVNLFPISIQREISKWVGTRVLQMNTGLDYFPDEFMVGASLATRQGLVLLTEQLKHKEIQAETGQLFGPALLHRFMSSVPDNTDIELGLPQIYDVHVDDIWVTLGPPGAFQGEPNFETIQWMTLQIGLNQTKEPEESFGDHKLRVKESIREGVQISVDVKIDADVVYHASREDEILIHDEGRRELRVRFATPYFSPGSKMVSSRDPETGYPENDWNWRIVDIDQLIEKEMMDE
ncbi:hypothetical protein G6F56_007563 [Rhizopus delemar]|nr:hypothetical protein G6F56_007563 [Rhizopus delemar]